MFTKSYLNGIAKAMDINNNIKIRKNNIPATISSAWRGVGDEIISSMITQNNSMSIKSEKLLKIANKRKLYYRNINLQKKLLSIEGINMNKKVQQNISKLTGNSSLHQNSMLKQSKALSERIMGLKATSSANLDILSMFKKSKALSERIMGLKATSSANLDILSMFKKSKALSERIMGLKATSSANFDNLDSMFKKNKALSERISKMNSEI